MADLSSIADGLRDLLAQRVRAASTLLAVAWGTFAVVAMMAFGAGLEELMASRAAGMGEGIAVVWPGATTRSWRGFGEGRLLRVDDEDVQLLAREVSELDAISPEYFRRDRVRRSERIFRTQITGVRPEWGALRNMHVRSGGRFLDDEDERLRRRAMFLGDRIARQLFDGEDPVGRSVKLAGQPFTVVGVMREKEQDSDYYGTDETRICIPASTFRQVFGQRWVSNFVYRARSPELLPRATERVYAVLGRELEFDPDDRQALSIWDTTDGDKIRSSAFAAMDVMMGLAGLFTLVVGGIGVGNLMFLSVRRRTGEIGLQIAVGARPRDVMAEMLLQSVVLVTVGGALGLLAAFGVSELVAHSPLAEELGRPRISPPLALGTALLLSVVGLGAGWFPARRAARLDPVRALVDA